MDYPEKSLSHARNFISLLQLVCKSPQNLALFDTQMNLAWSTDGYTGPTILPQSPRKVGSSGVDGIVLLKSEESEQCYLHALQIYRKDCVAFVVIQAQRELQTLELENLAHQLRVIQTCISKTDYLHERLSASVGELRHFQYLSNSIDSNGPVINSKREISRLLDDCISSMTLAGAFLYFANDKSMYTQIRNEEAFVDSGLAIKRRTGIIQRDLFRLCESGSAAFILAQFAETGVSSPKNDLHKLQIIVSPLLDGEKQAVGVLILARDRDASRFGKSDCRLAELMSERINTVFQARYDQASGFLNEAAYASMLQQRLVDCKSGSVESSFLLLRLDGLDEVFAHGGVDAGMHVVSQVAGLLGKRVRSRDLAGRLGNDEFALLLNNCKADNAKIVAAQILESLSGSTFDWQGRPHGIDANIGLVTLSPAFVSQENLLRAAREAIGDAREAGRFTAAFFNGLAGKPRELAKIDWDHRIYKTVVNSDFRLYCQPIEDACSYDDGVNRYELLLRPNSEDGVLMAPNVFISSARKLGLMRFVDQWVVRQAFLLAAAVNPDRAESNFRFTINLSADSLTAEFADYVLAEAETSGVQSEGICFDILEAAAMQNLRQSNSFIGRLKKRGFEFALDDFGTGIGAYSSLRNLSVDYVKLNGLLVKTMVHDPVSEAIVTSLATVCRSIGIKTIAESVENGAIREQLAKSGVDYVQGFQTGRPRAVETEFQALQSIGSIKTA